LQETIKIINHGLGGLKELKVIGCEHYFESQIKEQSERYAKFGTQSQSYMILPKILLETSMIVSIILFVIISQYYFTQSQTNITSVLAIFSVAAIRLIPAISSCFNALNSINHSSYAVDIIFSDLQITNKSKPSQELNTNSSHAPSDSSYYELNKDGYNRSLEFKNKIELINVVYSYPNSSTPSVNSVSLSIERGQSIAFIGKSGAGKTTLVDILLGLIDINSGDILIDNKSIYSDVRTWQNLVGYIPQSIFLIDDTIQKNIAFGVHEKLIDNERLQKVIKLAQLEKLIEELPDHIHTKVGERGILLSGGQRQRIGIARALYHQREILVLDEATSALDNETEKLVNEAINSLHGKLTMIIIAHRLSTVKQCDTIYLLDKGCIVDSGSYEDVVSRNKITS
jgi:ABC-type multidrug transport system fused ATPase/permease subunit